MNKLLNIIYNKYIDISACLFAFILAIIIILYVFNIKIHFTLSYLFFLFLGNYIGAYILIYLNKKSIINNDQIDDK